jgi:endonuclease YncB( thermonuclease family)
MVSTNISLPASLPFSNVLKAAESADSPNIFTCHVTGVHDGDGPIYCSEGQKIRLTAISATEIDETCRPGHPCSSTSGADAKAALERLALGQTLQCEATGTSYSRITAWCWRPDGTELNCAMVQGGYAVRWDKFDPGHRLCTQVSRDHAG